MQKKQQPKEN